MRFKHSQQKHRQKSAEAWTFVCREISSSLTKGLIIPIQSSDYKPSVDGDRFRPY